MKRVIISGGGTGGHIFPAIAIANALRKKEQDIDILFIGARGRMEMEKVPAAGYPIEGLPISGFQRRLTWKNLTFPFKLSASLIRARSIINRFGPDVVIGVGGYASGPTLRMATSKNIPAVIQEQNSYPGVTNRLLGSRVQKICVAYEGMEKYFPESKIVFTGNPIRQDIVNLAGKREDALAHFGLVSGRETVLVIGGSLGAGTINQAMVRFVTDSQPVGSIQILWQTGKYYYETVKAQLTSQDSELQNLVILPFIDRMDLAYAAADIIVSRAGAIAISELCVAGKPSILIPSPNVAEDHQTKNARALEMKNAALLIPDGDATEKLGEVIKELLSNELFQDELKKNIHPLGITDAADKIADVALSLIAGNKSPVKYTDAPQYQESEIKNPQSVYFLGIGGIGMSALARYYRLQGATVSGYDKTPTWLTTQLISEGMDIHFTEDPGRVPENTQLAVYTPAIPNDNAEYRYIQSRSIPLKKRAEILGMISSEFNTIAVAGTHGKTTTSAMIAHILRTAGLDFMAFLGGVSKNYGTNFIGPVGPGESPYNAKSGKSTYCIVEADEFDKSFLHLTPQMAIITSADADHLDVYGNLDHLQNSYGEFTSKIASGGSLILKDGTKVTPVNAGGYSIFSYSLTPGSGFFAKNIRIIEGLFHFDFVTPSGEITGMISGIPGRFNLENAIAALTAGYLLKIEEDHLRNAMVTYKGVLRRFDVNLRRPGFVYIDDYAHHPEELRACITAVRELYPDKKITGVFQPHLYSRTRDFADEFARSLGLLDQLILLDIYPAREEPIAGITSQMLYDRVKLQEKWLVSKESLLLQIRSCEPEVLLTLGAGDIDQFIVPITRLFSESEK